MIDDWLNMHWEVTNPLEKLRMKLVRYLWRQYFETGDVTVPCRVSSD